MKKYIISLAVVLAFVFYVIFTNRQPSGVALNDGPGAPAPTSTPVTEPSPHAAYKDGSYTGPVTDAFYGPLQVEAVIQGGKVADVHVLQSPDSIETSREVNGAALPRLIQEAIQVQKGQVNVVSGATQSSEAFAQSLTAALQQAKA